MSQRKAALRSLKSKNIGSNFIAISVISTLWIKGLIIVSRLSVLVEILPLSSVLCSKIMTAADDTMLKVFATGAELKEQEEPIDLSDEIFTICADQVDTIAVGGEDKKAYLYKVELNEDGTYKLAEGEKEIAMCFDTPVMKLEFQAGGKLLGVSQDSHVQVMDTETQKVTSFR